MESFFARHSHHRCAQILRGGAPLMTWFPSKRYGGRLRSKLGVHQAPACGTAMTSWRTSTSSSSTPSHNSQTTPIPCGLVPTSVAAVRHSSSLQVSVSATLVSLLPHIRQGGSMRSSHLHRARRHSMECLALPRLDRKTEIISDLRAFIQGDSTCNDHSFSWMT